MKNLNSPENNKYLTGINNGADLKRLSFAELDILCEEIRAVLVNRVSKNGGHLSSNLGVVEITVALHRELNLPADQIVWDVGHQAYVHKLLTGRLNQFHTLRQEGGISGFPHPDESCYDLAVGGHSSTSISMANGLAKAKALTGSDDYVVAVIGDGALTGGLAYEGLSNAGRSKDNLIVILNDNGMSISENVGYVARHLATLKASSKYLRFKKKINKIISAIPLVGSPLRNKVMNIKLNFKKKVYKKSSFFEEMGFYYIGPLDGHDLSELSKGIDAAKSLKKPALIHVATVKGKGYTHSEANPDIYHGLPAFNPETGAVACATECFSSVFADELVKIAEKDERICAISAAMTTGTGLDDFSKKFRKRFFDVGIAEEHGMVFASGLAAGGVIPVFAVYSTFLQRSYDQILNDTAIQNEHVVLAIDRAGIVGDDGVTHQGIFDVPFLNTIPNVTVYSPSCYAELRVMLHKAVYDTPGLVAVRYPRGGELGDFKDFKVDQSPFTLFEYDQLISIQNKNKKVLMVTYGRIFTYAKAAGETLNSMGYDVSVLKLNQIKPLFKSVAEISCEYDYVIFFEESHVSGGVAEHFGASLLTDKANRFTGVYEIAAIDEFVPVCKPLDGLHRYNLNAKGMISRVQKLVGNNVISGGNISEL